MTRRKVIAPDEPVDLKLTATERNAVLDSLHVMNARLQDRLRGTPIKQPVCYTLDELEELHGNLAFDANHSENRRQQKSLDKVLQKIDKLLQTYSDQPQFAVLHPAPTPDGAPSICGSEQVPREFRKVYHELVCLTDEFCNELLDIDYQQLCREMAIAVCQPGSPVASGKRAGWACGIVYSLGRINFLDDPSFEPHVPSKTIAEWFGVSTATMHSKAKIIRDGLGLVLFDPDFTLPGLLEQNPLAWMIDLNGFLFDVRDAPRDVQLAAYEQGLIPHLPDDRAQPPQPYTVVQQRVRSSHQQKVSTRPSTGNAYQIKVTLDGSRPLIWRRLHVPDCTLDVLHEIIQVALGWQNCHLHEFRAGDQRIKMASMEEFDEVDEPAREEADVLLSQLVDDGHQELHYWYDFGDDWWHTIKIEKTLESSPKISHPTCLAGARACPPEDIGGLPGFAEFLEAMADPRHERHEELAEWYGEPFDPDHFDRDEVNLLLSP